MKSKILFLDIETSPNIGYTWGKYEQNVIEYVQDWYILCASWKWLDEKRIHAVAQIDSPTFLKNKTDDANVIEALHKVLNKAEIVVVQNGASFDLPKINTRFLIHGLSPPSPYRLIDTLRVARRYFKFDSNKLDDLGKSLHIGRKIDTGGFELWKGCMAGDRASWSKMVKYNKQDVALLEEVYLKFRPWIQNFPNFSVISNRPTECAHCGGSHLQSRGTERQKNGRLKRRFKCLACGAWSYGKLYSA